MAIRRYEITATTGNDSRSILEPNSYDQWIYTWDGLAGTDQLGFDRLGRSEFTITKDAAGAIHVDSVSGASHIISVNLTNVEKLSFNSGRNIVDLVAMFGSDTTSPTVAVSSNVSSLGVGQSATITFTLSEVSTDFAASDVTVSGGSLANFTGSGISYSATFTPAAGSTANGVVSIASGKFTDAAGNANADGSDANNTVTMTVNTVPAGNTPSTTTGTSANNTFSSTSANEVFDGAGGLDTLVFSGLRSQYSLASQSSTSFRITDSVASRNGTDTVTRVERLQFSDVSIALDLDGNAGKVAKILGAVFGPSSVTNKSYVGIGLGLLDGGMSYDALAALAVSVTGKSSSTDVCNLLWTNVVGSAPTAANIASFKVMLDTGQMNIGSLTTLAADTSFNTTNIGLTGLSQTGLEYT